MKLGGVSTLALSLLLAGCFHKSRDVTEYVNRAQELTRAGSLDKARVELEKGLVIAPGSAELNYQLAQVEEQTGDLKSAIPHYMRAAAPDAHLLAAQLRFIELLVDSGHYQDASQQLNSTLGTFPNSLPAVALRADNRVRANEDAGARADADLVLRGEPSNARALAVRATLALKDHNASRALADVTFGLSHHPGDIRLLEVQAAAQMALNQPDKAVVALQAIMNAEPKNVIAQSTLAEIEASSGHYDSAVASFKQAVATNPSNQDMQLAFVRFLTAHKQPGEAVAVLQSLIANSPRQSTYDLVLAQYYQTNDEPQKSADVLEAAAKRLGSEPAVVQVDVALAKVESSRGDEEKAHAYIDTALRLDPSNSEALLFRSIMSAQEGHFSSAITDLLALVQNDPVNGRAFETLASSYLLAGQPKLAVQAMRRAVDVSPGDENREARLASMLQRAGNLTEAREVISRVVLRNPNSPAVWIKDGELAVDRKDWDEVSIAITHLHGLLGTSAAISVLEARLKAARGDQAGAFSLAKSTIATTPNQDPYMVAVLARAAVATNQIADAIEFLKAQQPKLQGETLQETWKAMMTLEADLGNDAAADQAFRKAVSLTPTKSELYIAYGQILIARKTFAEAQTVMQQGIAAGASKWQLEFMQGAIEQASGDLPAALTTFERVAAENPSSIDAANNAGSLLADLQPKDTEALTKAREKLGGYESTSNPSLIDTIAWLDYRLGRFDEARLLLARIDAARSASPQVRFHYGAVLVASGDRAAGAALLDSVKDKVFIGSDEARSLSAS